jgi:predicted porin
MKKTLIALAAVAATGAAFAQSTVTLYGIADIGYATTTSKSTAGVTTAKTNGMVSGVQSGSRWGVRGTEDLGGGLKANFNFESAIGANDGTGNNAFGRRSVVELEGGFGKVGLGRDYTPSFSLIGGTDVTGTDAATTSDLYPAGVRADNMFMYTSPSFGGVVAKAGLVSQKSGTPADPAKTNGVDVSVSYSAGPLMVGAGFGNSKVNTSAVAAVAPVTATSTVNGVLGSAAVAATQTKNSHTVIGATYDLGVAKLFANQINYKNKSTNAKSAETNLGVSAPMGAVTLMAGVGMDNDKSAAGAKSKATDYMLGANYSLSKRTNAYARYDVDQTPAVSGTKAKKTALNVGVRHTF